MSRSHGRRPVKDPATGGLKLVTRKSPPRKDYAFRRLERSVPREEWLAACQASSNEKVQTFLRNLTDPFDRKKSLPQLASEAGLTYAQVLVLIREYHIDQGFLAMSKHVPRVMEDVAIDAQSTMVPCPTCQGESQLRTFDQKTGAVNGSKPCWCCDGTGKLRKVGDPDARKLMFKSLKLVNDGPLFAQQIVNAGGAALEDAVGKVGDVLDVTPGRTTP